MQLKWEMFLNQRSPDDFSLLVESEKKNLSH